MATERSQFWILISDGSTPSKQRHDILRVATRTAKIIDQYYEQYEQFEDEFPEQNRFKRLFFSALETIKCVFPEIAEVPRWGNRADYYSLFVAFGNLLQGHNLPRSSEAKARKELIKLAEEIDERLEDAEADTSEPSKAYASAIEKGSNDKARRTDRHEVLCGVIKPLLKRNRIIKPFLRNKK